MRKGDAKVKRDGQRKGGGLASGIFVAASIVLCVLVGGCEETNVRIGLIVVDEALGDCEQIRREVILVMPDSTQTTDALSAVVVQAQREGWRTTGGSGRASGPGERYAPTAYLHLEIDPSSHRGAVISAVREFPVTSRGYSGVFTAIFGPCYQLTGTGRKHKLVGKLHAKAIWRALYVEARKYARRRGYSTDSLSVSFEDPVTWGIICPAQAAQASRGEVWTCGRDRVAVQSNMYGSEFLAEVPITVEWEDRPDYSAMVRAAIGAIWLLMIIGGVIWYFARARQGPVRARHP